MCVVILQYCISKVLIVILFLPFQRNSKIRLYSYFQKYVLRCTLHTIQSFWANTDPLKITIWQISNTDNLRSERNKAKIVMLSQNGNCPWQSLHTAFFHIVHLMLKAADLWSNFNQHSLSQNTLLFFLQKQIRYCIIA